MADAYLRVQQRSRITGTLVSIYDSSHPDNVFDPDGGRWVTVCEDHGTLVNHRTLALAKAHLPHAVWCEECQAESTPRG